MWHSLQRNKSQLYLFMSERWRCDTPPRCHSDNTFISRAITTLSPRQRLFVFMPVLGKCDRDERLVSTRTCCEHTKVWSYLNTHLLINWLCPTVRGLLDLLRVVKSTNRRLRDNKKSPSGRVKEIELSINMHSVEMHTRDGFRGYNRLRWCVCLCNNIHL